MIQKKKLILIDGNALIHRAFHALPTLTSPKGELVNAIYGFMLVLLRVLKEFQPDYILSTFDLPEPTFRHKEYEEYKATRPKAPDELYAQIPKIKELLEAFNIPIYEKAGYEADDVIGTIVSKVGGKVRSIIVTGDLDTLQLVDEDTVVFTLKKGIRETVIYNEEAVMTRYGLRPDQLPDFKGLEGDPSDNIPGVPGIGEKTAIKLIQEFGSLENLYSTIARGKEISTLSEHVRVQLKDNKDQAFFSKYLATIKQDVPFRFDLEKCRWGGYNRERVIEIFRELGFKSLIERLPEIGKSENRKIGKSDRREEVLKDIERAYKDKILSRKVYELERDLVPVIEEMEKRGVKVDVDYLKKIGERLDAKLRKLEEGIYNLAGTKFNISSSQQLSEVLFKGLKIPVEGLRKTPGGVVSTAAPELRKLRTKYPIIQLVEKYRELTKLKTTYVDALPKMVNPETGRIHTTFRQLGTATGRISSLNPNLQNIPVRSELGREIRKAFVAERGYQLLSVDYSQIELRIAASIAKDQKMIRAFKQGKDVHALTAAEVYNVPQDKVTPSMRRRAKALNFGVLYGMSIPGFAESAGVSHQKAKRFIDEYMRDFTGIKNYVEEIKGKARKQGYVETLLGRRRYLPQIDSSNWLLRQQSERMAINAPIQGSAADIIKLAMIEVSKLGPTCRLILQVHDELLFEIKSDIIKEAASKIKKIMENIYQLKVPLVVDIRVGDSWGELRRV